MTTQEWYDNEALTKPQEFVITVSEKEPYSWDVSARLGDGETASSPEIKVFHMRNAKANKIIEDVSSNVSVIGADVIVGTLDGSKLTEGELYRVVVTFNANPGKRTSCITMLRCVA